MIEAHAGLPSDSLQSNNVIFKTISTLVNAVNLTVSTALNSSANFAYFIWLNLRKFKNEPIE